MQVPKLQITGGYSKLCFACGRDNPIGLKLNFVQDGEMLKSSFIPGEFHQGWQGITHGGILCTLLDEAAAYAIICKGIDCVTGKSEVRFRHTSPIKEPIQISAQVTKLTRKLAETQATLALENGTIIAESSSLWYIVGQSKMTVLWDLDGVIADSNSFHFAAWQETFAKRGTELTREAFNKLFGSRNDFIIQSILGKGTSETDIEAIIQEKETSFREKAKGNIKPFPGAISLLNTIKKGNFKQALVSSAPRENIGFVTGELDIGEYFDCIVSGHEVAESKPSPQIFLLAAQKLAAAPENCIVIEDSPLGIKAAKTAGMRCLAVANTHSKQDLNEADDVVDSLVELDLISFIKGLMR